MVFSVFEIPVAVGLAPVRYTVLKNALAKFFPIDEAEWCSACCDGAGGFLNDPA